MTKVLYITYIDMDAPRTSGSSVRPYKILEAFKQLEYDVYLLSGSDGNQSRKQRKEKVKQANKWLDNNCPDFCYIESGTYPIMLKDDIKLIKRIHEKGIPIGYFYRDFYRKFPNLFPRRRGMINSCKEFILDYLQYRTDKVLNKVDIVYVPSKQAASLFKYKVIKPLPPAGENMLAQSNKFNRTIIYVGGISKHYDIDILFETFTTINVDRHDDLYKLILVCRKDEWEKSPYSKKNLPWLSVYHAYGDELKSLYRAAAAAVVTKPKNEYNDLAISVKLFEYMSYGLPVIAMKNEAMSSIISKYDIGKTVANTDEMIQVIVSLLSDNVEYKRLQKNVENALLRENLWVHRVKQIESDLLNVNSFMND